MTIYSGSVSHKNGIGRVRDAVATDNTSLARAFGVDGIAGETYSNGKIGMLQLSGEASHAQIAIDPAEMKREDDMTYVRNHLASIVNFEQLAVAISYEYRAELSAILHKIDSKLQFNTLTNENRALVVKVLLDILTVEDIKQELIGNDNDQALVDTIRRNATAIFYEQDSQVGGLDYSLTARGTTDIDVKKSAHKISVRIKIKGVTNGSASSAGSAFKQNFVDIKKAVTMVGAQDYVRTVIYNESYDVENIVQDVINVVSQYARETVRRAVKDINERFAEIENYNPAGAKSKLWNELGITVTDIPQTSIPDIPLREYASGQITALQFANLPETNFGLRFAKATAKRIENADIEMLAEAYVDKTFNNLPAEIRQEKITEALTSVENAVDKVSQNILSITAFDEAYKLYQSSNQTFVDMIMQQINPSAQTEDITKLSPVIVSKWTAETARYITDELLRKAEYLFESIGYTNASLIQPALKILDLNALGDELAPNVFENEIKAKVEKLRVPEEISIAIIGEASLTVSYDNILQKHFVRKDLVNKLLELFEQNTLDNMSDELHHAGVNATNAQIINALRNAYSGRYNQMVLNNKDDVSVLVAKVEKQLKREVDGNISNADYDAITQAVHDGLINASFNIIVENTKKSLEEARTIVNDIVKVLAVRRQVTDNAITTFSDPDVTNVEGVVESEISKQYDTIKAQVIEAIEKVANTNDTQADNKKLAMNLMSNAVRNEINRVVYQIVNVDWQAPKYVENVFTSVVDENEIVAEVLGDLSFEEKPSRQDIENLLRDKLPDARLKERLLRKVDSDKVITTALNNLAEKLALHVDGYGTLDVGSFVDYFKNNVSLDNVHEIFSATKSPQAFINKYKDELGRLLKYGNNAKVVENLAGKKDKVMSLLMNEAGLLPTLSHYFEEKYDSFILELVATPETYKVERDTDLTELSEEQLATISGTRIINMAEEVPVARIMFIDNVKRELVDYLKMVSGGQNFFWKAVFESVAEKANRLSNSDLVNYAYSSATYREKLVSDMAEIILQQDEKPDNVALIVSQIRKRYTKARDNYVEEIMGNTVNTARSLIVGNIDKGIDDVVANIPESYDKFKAENNGAESPQLFVDAEFPISDVDWHVAQLARFDFITDHATEIIVADIVAVVANTTGFKVPPTVIANMVKNQMSSQVRLQTLGNEDKYMQFVKDNETELNESQI